MSRISSEQIEHDDSCIIAASRLVRGLPAPLISSVQRAVRENEALQRQASLVELPIAAMRVPIWQAARRASRAVRPTSTTHSRLRC
jgi:hypothetical protein